MLVDLDPQGNATMGSGVDKNALELSIYDVLVHRSAVAEGAQDTDPAGYGLLPANADLTAAEVELLQAGDRNSTRLDSSHVAISDCVFSVPNKEQKTSNSAH